MRWPPRRRPRLPRHRPRPPPSQPRSVRRRPAPLAADCTESTAWPATPRAAPAASPTAVCAASTADPAAPLAESAYPPARVRAESAYPPTAFRAESAYRRCAPACRVPARRGRRSRPPRSGPCRRSSPLRSAPNRRTRPRVPRRVGVAAHRVPGGVGVAACGAASAVEQPAARAPGAVGEGRRPRQHVRTGKSEALHGGPFRRLVHGRGVKHDRARAVAVRSAARDRGRAGREHLLQRHRPDRDRVLTDRSRNGRHRRAQSRPRARAPAPHSGCAAQRHSPAGTPWRDRWSQRRVRSHRSALTGGPTVPVRPQGSGAATRCTDGPMGVPSASCGAARSPSSGLSLSGSVGGWLGRPGAGAATG